MYWNVLDCIGLCWIVLAGSVIHVVFGFSLSLCAMHYVHIYQLTTGELVSANQLKTGELDTQTAGKQFQISSLFLVFGAGFLLTEHQYVFSCTTVCFPHPSRPGWGWGGWGLVYIGWGWENQSGAHLCCHPLYVAMQKHKALRYAIYRNLLHDDTQSAR